jgi:hypothetical protein
MDGTNYNYEVLEELRVLTGLLKSGSQGLNASKMFDKSIEEMIRSGKKLTLAEMESAQAYLNSRGQLNTAEKQYLETINKKLKLEQTLQQATGTTIQSFSKLTDALLSSERNFSKYSDGLRGLGDAAKSVGDELGGWKKYVGNFVKGSTEVVSAYFKQADSVLKANDDLSKLGTAGSFSTKELLNMGHNAYLTSKNLDLLVNPIKSLGSGLINLGGTTGEGVKAFSKLTAITQEQQLEYQKLGVSQGELIQTQSDFIKLQAIAGVNLRNETKDRVALQKASLEYQDRLLELAALTGEDVESIKKKQQDSVRAYEFQVGLAKLELDARKARTKEEADTIRNEIKNRQIILERVSALGNEVVTKGVRQFLSTGQVVGDVIPLVQQGLLPALQQMRDASKSNADATEISNKFIDQANERQQIFIEQGLGTLASLPNDMKETFGQTTEVMEKFNRFLGISVAEQSKLVQGQIAAGKTTTDPMLETRAQLTSLEQKAAVGLDKLIAAVSPLTNGLNATSAAGTAAAIALMGLKNAASDLITGKGGGGSGVIGDIIGGVAGGALAGKIFSKGTTPTVPGTVGAASGGGFSSLLGRIFGPVLGGAFGMAQLGNIEQQEKAGAISSREATAQRAGTVGAVGAGGAGALIGAGVGQVLIPIPGVGALIGGAIGGLVGGTGGYYGGKGIANLTTSGDKKENNLNEAIVNSPTGGGQVLRVSIVDSIPLRVIINEISETLSGKSDILEGMKPGDFSRMISGSIGAAFSGDASKLTSAMVQVESSGNTNAVSPKGATGLMQVLPSTAMSPGFGMSNIFEFAKFKGEQTLANAQELLRNPEIGMKYGEMYMKSMLEKYGGNLIHSLVAYNWGPANADKWIKAGADKAKLPEETRNYISKVSRLLGESKPYAKGGMILGPGTGTSDSVPAFNRNTGQPVALSTGEYVLPASITSMIGKSTLDSMISNPNTLKRQKGGVIPGMPNNIASVQDLGDGRRETMYSDGTLKMSGPDGEYYFKNGEFLKYVSPTFAGISKTLHGSGEEELNYNVGPLSISQSSSGRKRASYDAGLARMSITGQGNDITEASITGYKESGEEKTVSFSKEEIMKLLEVTKSEENATTTGIAGTAEPIKEALTPYLDKQNDSMAMLSTLFEKILGAIEDGNGIQQSVLNAARN